MTGDHASIRLAICHCTVTDWQTFQRVVKHDCLECNGSGYRVITEHLAEPSDGIKMTGVS